MTSPDTLRHAAALMRERASLAIASAPLVHDDETGKTEPQAWYGPHALSSRLVAPVPDSEHIASWHPAVGLAVADWLEVAARRIEWHAENGGVPYLDDTYALAVARAYLGE